MKGFALKDECSRITELDTPQGMGWIDAQGLASSRIGDDLMVEGWIKLVLSTQSSCTFREGSRSRRELKGWLTEVCRLDVLRSQAISSSKPGYICWCLLLSRVEFASLTHDSSDQPSLVGFPCALEIEEFLKCNGLVGCYG